MYKSRKKIRRLPDKDKACIPIIAMTANALKIKRCSCGFGMNGRS